MIRRDFLKSAIGIFLPVAIPLKAIERAAKLRMPWEFLRGPMPAGVLLNGTLTSIVGVGGDYTSLYAWEAAWHTFCRNNLPVARVSAEAILLPQRDADQGYSAFPAGWKTDEESSWTLRFLSCESDFYRTRHNTLDSTEGDVPCST
ncbi:MAG: hypothetical protein V2A73_17420 [Pseudomonadota bacterium]